MEARLGHSRLPAAERGGHQGGSGARRGEQAAGLRELAALAREPLRVGVGTENVGHHRRPAGSAAGVGARGSQDRRRVRVRAVAEHDVEEDHGCRGVVRLPPDVLDPRRWVEHRVGPAPGELLLAEVEADVRAVRGRRGPRWPQRDVRVHGAELPAEQDHGLVAQGASGEQAPDRHPLRIEPGSGLPHRFGKPLTGSRRGRAEQPHRRRGSLLQGPHQPNLPRSGQQVLQPDQGGDRRLAPEVGQE